MRDYIERTVKYRQKELKKHEKYLLVFSHFKRIFFVIILPVFIMSFLVGVMQVTELMNTNVLESNVLYLAGSFLKVMFQFFLAGNFLLITLFFILDYTQAGIRYFIHAPWHEKKSLRLILRMLLLILSIPAVIFTFVFIKLSLFS